MLNVGLETSLWKAIAVSANLESALGRIAEILRRQPNLRAVNLRPAWVGSGQGIDARAVVAWLGESNSRFVRDDERPPGFHRTNVAGASGFQAFRLVSPGVESPVLVLECIEQAVSDRLGELLCETVAAAVSAELRRPPPPDEPGERSTGAIVRNVPGDEAVIGSTTGLASVMQRVEMVAPQDVPVLLLGETGSGKELIARAVHVRSRRAKGPFVRVNCGAIPRDLVDSELFGHEKGSFTGAGDRQRGWFERAHTGTLLLDEIGELPLDAQVRLLRILQDGTFNRVGGHEPVTVQVRIIAATHRDLPVMVDQRAFREDLWYRIATFPIHIPPLRERPQDIAELARNFIRKAGIRFGLPAPQLDPDSLRLLQTYSWPGNIRELGAVLDRAMILGEGRVLDVAAALGQGLRTPSAPEHSPGLPPAGAMVRPFPSSPLATPANLSQAMKRHIETALGQSFGRIEGPFGAAAALGINPHTLRSRMRKLGIDWKKFKRPGN